MYAIYIEYKKKYVEIVFQVNCDYSDADVTRYIRRKKGDKYPFSKCYDVSSGHAMFSTI